MTNREMVKLVDGCKFPGVRITFNLESLTPYVQIRNGEWSGRKWALSTHMTPGEVVQTVFAAVMAWQEHETREAFKFKGKAIFGPHISLKVLEERSEDVEVRG